MSKVFDVDFRKGTLIDSVSKTKGTLTTGNGGFKKTSKGTAMLFDGSSTKVSVSDNDTLDITSGVWSLVAFIKLKSMSGYNRIVGKQDSSSQCNYGIGLQSGKYFGVFFNDNGSTFNAKYCDSVPIDDNKYHMVIGQWTGSQLKIYIDNDLKTTYSVSGSSVSNSAPLLIGLNSSSGSEFFNGFMRYVAGFNHNLSQTEMNELFKKFNSYDINKPISGFKYPKPKVLNKSKLGDNLVTNGNMELDSNWNDYTTPTTNERSSEQYVSGIYSRKLVTSSSSQGIKSDTLTTVTNKTYKVSFNVYPVDSTYIRVAIRKGDDTGWSKDYSTSSLVQGSWNKVNISFTDTAGGSNAYIAIHSGTHGAGTWYIDDVTFQEENNLLAAYNMVPINNKVVDISNNNNTLTLYRISSNKEGLTFDSDNKSQAYLSSNSQLHVDVHSSPLTICAYLKPTKDVSSIKSVVTKNSAYGLSFDSGNKFAAYSGASSTNLISNTSFMTGKKYTVVLVYDKTEVSIYVNGVLDNKGTINGYSSDTAPFGIGGININGYYSDMEIYDVRLFDYDFDVKEVREYHNSFVKPTFLDDMSNYGADEKDKPIGDYETLDGYYSSISEHVMKQGNIINTFTGGTNMTSVSSTGYTQDYSSGSTENVGCRDSSGNVFTPITAHRYKVTFDCTINSGSITGTFAFSSSGIGSQTITEGSNTYEIITGNSNNGAYITINSSTPINYTISNFSFIELPPIKGIGSGTKYLTTEENAGIKINYPISNAHGTWEYSISADDANPYVRLCNSSDGDNNYWISPFYNGTRFSFGASYSGGTKVFTGSGYTAANEWYDVKVQRLIAPGTFPDIDTLQTSDMVNAGGSPAYTTFTSNGRYGFEAASDGDGYQECGTVDELSIENNAKYLVEFDLTKNSGTLPVISLKIALGSADCSNTETCVEGFNSFVLTATSTTTGVLQFANYNGNTSDYKVEHLRISRIYDKDTWALFIRGGKFGDDGWTLVDPTYNGGSGSNPFVEGTYTTGDYLRVAVHKKGKITNIKYYDGVKQ